MRGRYLIVAILAASVAGSLSRPAAAADICEQAGEKGYNQINQSFDPKITLFLRIADELKKKGFDAKRYPVVKPDGTVEVFDIADFIANMAAKKRDLYLDVKSKVDECNKGFETPQKIVDGLIFLSTGGISALVPASYTHVDLSEIVAGYPLGGPNALIPNIRDQILNGLGIGGDVACVIRDPKKIFGGC